MIVPQTPTNVADSRNVSSSLSCPQTLAPGFLDSDVGVFVSVLEREIEPQRLGRTPCDTFARNKTVSMYILYYDLNDPVAFLL